MFGVTWLCAVPHFDIIRGTSVDYMHCILLGVCRHLLELWINTSQYGILGRISNNWTSVYYSLSLLKDPLQFGEYSKILERYIVPAYMIIGANLSEPHTYQYYEKIAIPMCVCMYVVIRCPRTHHARALACVCHKVQAGKDHQHVPCTCVNSEFSSPKLLQESLVMGYSKLVSGAEQQKDAQRTETKVG